MICKICKQEFDTNRKLYKHIRTIHNMPDKDYYDTYCKKDTDGICPTCGKQTVFLSIDKGYRHHCCCSCKNNDLNIYNAFRQNNPQKDENIRNKTKQTCLEKYGNEYAIASKEVKNKISIIQKSKVNHPRPTANALEVGACKSSD